MTEPVKIPIERIMERFKRTNPKLYRRYQQKKNEVRRQPKIPGLMGGGGAGLFSFKKKKTDKEEASKENNIKKQVNKKQKRLEELKKEISSQSKGGVMKKFSKGGMADYYKDIL